MIREENYEIWHEGVEHAIYSPISLPSKTGVLIIGGGITGITSAYLLAKEGINPILLEKNEIGEFVTCATTGFLTQILDTAPSKLVSLYSKDTAREIFKSHQNAIDEIEKIIISEKIECEFERCSNYIYANSKKEEKLLLKLTEKYKSLGVNAEYKKDNKLKFNSFGYIEIFNQAKFHALKYVNSLAQIAVKNGAIISENAKVLNLKKEKEGVLVEIENVPGIKAKKVFSATYMPFGKPPHLERKYNMYRSYVVEYKIPKNIMREGTYEDTLKPYHYFRIDSKADFDRLIIGGNDNLSALKIDHELGSKVIKDYTKELFKNNDFEEVRHWSGSISEPVNKIACIGETLAGQANGENIFYAFGFSGNGLTYSYIASKIFTDQLVDKNNPYSKIYSINNKIPWWKNIF